MTNWLTELERMTDDELNHKVHYDPEWTFTTIRALERRLRDAEALLQHAHRALVLTDPRIMETGNE